MSERPLALLVAGLAVLAFATAGLVAIARPEEGGVIAALVLIGVMVLGAGALNYFDARTHRR
jgi:uncharacterized membrane protein